MIIAHSKTPINVFIIARMRTTSKGVPMEQPLTFCQKYPNTHPDFAVKMFCEEFPENPIYAVFVMPIAYINQELIDYTMQWVDSIYSNVP